MPISYLPFLMYFIVRIDGKNVVNLCATTGTKTQY